MNQTAPARLPACPAEGLPNGRRFRPGQLDAFRQGCLGVLADPSIGGRTQGLPAVSETPEAIQAYLLRARRQDDGKRPAHGCVEAAQETLRLVNARGWLRASAAGGLSR